MKKLSFIALALAAMAFAGCQLEREIESPRNLGDSTVIATLGSSTRSYLEASEEGESTTYNVYWSAPDQILIAFAGGKPALYTSTNAEPAQTAAFRGTFPAGEGSLYGIYPAEDGNAVDADGIISIQFHAEQTAVAGSYDPQASPAVAVSEAKDLSFMNVCGLLALKVGWDDVSKITLDGAMSKTLIPGGVLSVSMDEEPVLEDWSEDLDGISLLPPSGESVFSKDEIYYMAVPPCSFPSGASFIVERADGEEVITIDGSVSVERAKVHDVPVLYIEPVVLVESIELEADAIEVDYDAEPFTIEASVSPENADDKSLSWESSDPDVVTVDADGVVTVVGSGEATVTATANDGSEVSASVTITVLLPANRISYDGGETWAPLNIAVVNYDSGWDELSIVVGSDPEADWENLLSYPPGDWFGIDIDPDMLGNWELPEYLDDDAFCYMSWKGMSVTDEPGYSVIYPENTDGNMLNINVASDLSSIDLEADIEYGSEHVIVIYSGPAVEISNYVPYYLVVPVDNPASQDEIAEWIEGLYYLDDESAYYSGYVNEDYLVFESFPNNTPGVVYVYGSMAEVEGVEFYAYVDKKADGEYVIVIPGMSEIFYGDGGWAGSDLDLYLTWVYEDEDGYLSIDDSDIEIAVSGDHELSLIPSSEYVLLLNYNSFSIVDLLIPDTFVFTYLGASFSPAPAHSPRAVKSSKVLPQGKGMLKMRDSKPIKKGDFRTRLVKSAK